MKPIIELNDIVYRYKNLMFSFNLKVKKNSVVAIIGESGAGKSTLIELIAGFLKTENGTILLVGKDQSHSPPYERPISILFQENNLFFHLTVAENIALAFPKKLKISENQRLQVLDILKKVGLEGKENVFPSTLSGGEKQRVTIARTLIQSKPIVILDEPFVGLSPGLRHELLELLLNLRKKSPFTLLIVTHEPRDIISLDATYLFIHNNQIWEKGHAQKLFSKDCSPEIQNYLGPK